MSNASGGNGEVRNKERSTLTRVLSV